MRVVIRTSFDRDLKKIRDSKLRDRVRAILESALHADTLREVEDVQPISGHPSHFRIRVGEFRIGVRLDGDILTFARFATRRDFYRIYP